MEKARRKDRGCDGPSATLVGFSFDPALKRCPWAAYEPEVFSIINMHARATGRLRQMPFGGRYEDQPLWVGQAFDIIEQVRAETRARDAKAQAAKEKALAEKLGKG